MKKNLLATALILGGLMIGQSTGDCMSLSLVEAIQQALVNNPDVAITRLGEDMAQASLRQQRGKNSFAWKVSTSFGESNQDNNGWNSSNGNSISGSLPIFSGGVNQNNIKSSELDVDIAQMKTQRKGQTIQLDVIKAYYDVLEAQKQVSVYQDSVDKYASHLNNVEQLYSAGSKAKIDVLRSQVELSDAQQTLTKGQNEYTNNLSTLRNLMYMDQQEPLELTDDFHYRNFSGDVNSCVAQALNNRKELLIDSITLQQKELALKSAKAGYQPTVDLTLRAGWDKQLIPSGDNHEYSASIGASWNIFDSGITASKVTQAQLDLESAKLTLNKDKSDIDMSLRKNYNSMREAEKRFNSTQQAVKEAEEDYFIANEKYKSGEGIMLDIIDAQNALANARQNYISAQYDYARYKAAVESDMGLDILPAAVSSVAETDANATATTAVSAS